MKTRSKNVINDEKNGIYKKNVLAKPKKITRTQKISKDVIVTVKSHTAETIEKKKNDRNKGKNAITSDQ